MPKSIRRFRPNFDCLENRLTPANFSASVISGSLMIHGDDGDSSIVLTQTGEHFVDEFSSDYPLLASYLNTRYRRVGAFDAERSNRLEVWLCVRPGFG